MNELALPICSTPISVLSPVDPLEHPVTVRSLQDNTAKSKIYFFPRPTLGLRKRQSHTFFQLLACNWHSTSPSPLYRPVFFPIQNIITLLLSTNNQIQYPFQSSTTGLIYESSAKPMIHTNGLTESSNIRAKLWVTRPKLQIICNRDFELKTRQRGCGVKLYSTNLE